MLSEHLLVDAALRMRGLGEHAGCALLVVDAMDDNALRFYARYGFVALPSQATEAPWPRRMILPWQTLQRLTVLGTGG